MKAVQNLMPIGFLHTGDWHIGKPFGGMPPDKAPQLRAARLHAVSRLADVARDNGVRTILVAGDLYDKPGLADRDIRQPLGQMRAFSDIVWHVIPGNHDPASAGGVWERAMRDGLPDNVRLHLTLAPVEIAPSCWLLPAPLSAKALSHDPTAWMDGAVTPPGHIRIGLAHGSIRGFGSERSASIEIAPDRAKRAGLDYLALGDWHGTREITARTWYSGTPEPDGYLDNSPGNALLVDIAGAGAQPLVQRRDTATYKWIERRIDAARSTDLAALEGEIEGLGARALHVLLNVEASGRATVKEDRDLHDRLDRLDARVFHLVRRMQGITLGLGADDIERLATEPLREIGRALALSAADPSAPDNAVATVALRRLLELAEALGPDAQIADAQGRAA